MTTFIDFTAQENREGLISSINRRFEEAKPAAIDYSLHACIAQFTEEVANQIKLLPDLGIMSFKIFTSRFAGISRFASGFSSAIISVVV